jgi:hypothetical protein
LNPPPLNPLLTKEGTRVQRTPSEKRWGGYKSDPDKARQMLTDLTNGFAEKALMETKEKLKK